MIINVKEQCHVICKKNEGLMLIVQVPVVPLMVFTFFYTHFDFDKMFFLSHICTFC